ncbi:MAG: hypothetical protein GC182_17975 [Rhodopseudomonas sp.]|nr:hypothetical protein [Rhodopseudomonas sp.]
MLAHNPCPPTVRTGVAVLLALAMVASGRPAAHADGIQDIVDSTYRNAVVKIDVSSNTPSFDGDGNNICKSEGTGFFVYNRSTIVTATHVIELPPACGDVIVIARSRKNKWERLVKPLDNKDDVILLGTEPISGNDMCALLPVSHDAFDTDGFRFGIPAGFLDPEPISLKILDEHGEFDPLVKLNPATVRGGESGGPVFYRFNVAGIVKSRLKASDYGLMIRANVIRDLLAKKKIIRDDAFLCNPMRYAFASTDNQPSLHLDLSPPSGLNHIGWSKMATDLSAAIDLTANSAMFGKTLTFKQQSSQSYVAVAKAKPESKWWDFNHYLGADTARIDEKSALNAGAAVNDALLAKWWGEYLSALKTAPPSRPTVCTTKAPC